MSFSIKNTILGILLLLTASVGIFAPVSINWQGQALEKTYVNADYTDYVKNTFGSDPNKEAIKGKVLADGAVQKAIEGFFSYLMMAIMGFFATLVWASGLLLNYVSFQTVVQMSVMVKQIGAINAGWITFRDLANIVLIFLLLIIGISTILRVSGYRMKDLLARVIIIALLINFSLFFTNIVIDTSNLLATQFYYKSVGIDVKTNPSVLEKLNAGGGIATRYMKALSLTSLYGFDTNTGEISTNKLDLTNIFLIGIMASLLFIITAAVFFAAALMLISRFIILIFLMVVSPLAFVAMAIPSLKTLASKWWSALINNALFAPIFFLFTWFTLKIIEGDGFRQAIGLVDSSGTEVSSAKYSGLTTGDPGSIVILVNFLIVIGFTVASLVIAKQMSVFGASKATGWAQKGVVHGFKTGGRWTKRRLAPLAREIESGEEQTRHRLNPMRVAMKGARHVGKVASYIPGVREGLQNVSQSYRDDVKKKSAGYEKFSTPELKRRLGKFTLPIDKAAITQAITKKEDLDSLSFEQIQKARTLSKNTGVSTAALDKFRPEADSLEKIATNVSKQKATDVSKLHKVVVSHTGDNKENVDKMLDAMVLTYSGGHSAALGMRKDELTSSYIEHIKELSKHLKGQNGIEEIDTEDLSSIADFLEKVDEKMLGINLDADPEKNKEKLSAAKRSRQTAADYFRSVPAQRVWAQGKGKDSVKNEKNARETAEEEWVKVIKK